MINAVMHLVAWALVAVLVWASWFRSPAPERGEFGALAELAPGFYLVGERGPEVDGGGRTGFGLLRYGKQGFGYRSLLVEDWDGLLQGRLLALCPVRDYPGEVLILVQLPGAARLVHLQVRRWDKSPKTALLGSVDIEQPGPWRAMACGLASAQTMEVELIGEQSLRGRFNFGDFSWQAQPVALPPADAAYRDGAGLWWAQHAGQGLATEIWLQPAQGDSRLMYRLDGFRVTGLAAGPGDYALSLVTAEPGLGGVWRPLAPVQP